MTTTTPFEQGPYLSAALLCEKVLTEQDGVKLAIRIIDRVTRTVAGPSPPEDMAPFDYEVTLLLRLKSGRARGGKPLRIVLVKPSGGSSTPLHQTISFEGEDDRGWDVVVNMRIRIEEPSVYWFQVYLDDVRLTQVPLRVVYQVRRIHGPTGGPPPTQEPPAGS